MEEGVANLEDLIDLSRRSSIGELFQKINCFPPHGSAESLCHTSWKGRLHYVGYLAYCIHSNLPYPNMGWAQGTR